MGLFTKIKVCEKCGKEFEAGLLYTSDYCKECDAIYSAQVEDVLGYLVYSDEIKYNDNFLTDFELIAKHRNAILEKFRIDNTLTEEELNYIGKNYKKFTEAELEEAIYNIKRVMYGLTLCCAYNGKFFAPTSYSRTIIDPEDVFAVALTGYDKNTSVTRETIVCVLFTNDPYMPVFPIVFSGELGFFELSKSKKGREAAAYLLETVCPNLTYPILDVKGLKKIIKKEKAVKGNVNYQFVLQQLDNANLGRGIFNLKGKVAMLFSGSKEMLRGIGYYSTDDISKYVSIDDLEHRLNKLKRKRR